MEYSRAMRNTGLFVRQAALAVMVSAILGGAALRAVAAEAPRRVVSMNLCTDQLAMLLAAPGQLYSVSHLALRPEASILAGEARRFVVNHGLAEEIFLMKPDLILAGTFSTRATVNMLRRLGFRVEEFAPETSFADIAVNLRRLGSLLGQEERAEQLVRRLDDELARYARAPQKRASAATYYANSYTSGGGTLVAEAMKRAGLDNIAERQGLTGATRLPLEVLVMSAPDLIVGGTPQPHGTSLAEQAPAHPALSARAGEGRITVPDKYWLCGAPFTAEAVRILAEASARLAR